MDNLIEILVAEDEMIIGGKISVITRLIIALKEVYLPCSYATLLLQVCETFLIRQGGKCCNNFISKPGK